MARRRSVTTLRPLEKRDAESLSTWLPAVASSLGCDAWSNADAFQKATGQNGVLAVVEGASTEGLLVCELAKPKRDAACVALLVIEPSRRRLGIGGRAALALERRLARQVKRIYVQVPSRLGLALYFWLRLGYRPLTQGEWPPSTNEPPSVWMVRELG